MKYPVTLHLDFCVSLTPPATSQNEAEYIVSQLIKYGQLKLMLDGPDYCEVIDTIKLNYLHDYSEPDNSLPFIEKLKEAPSSFYPIEGGGLVITEESKENILFFPVLVRFNWYYIPIMKRDVEGKYHRLTDIWFNDASPKIVKSFSNLTKEDFFKLELEAGGITDEFYRKNILRK